MNDYKTHPKSADWNLKACDTCIPGSQAGGFWQVEAEGMLKGMPLAAKMYQHSIPLKNITCNVNPWADLISATIFDACMVQDEKSPFSQASHVI